MLGWGRRGICKNLTKSLHEFEAFLYGKKEKLLGSVKVWDAERVTTGKF